MEWAVVVSTLVAVGSAIFSAVMASRARQADAEAARLRDLESRLSVKKAGLYEPMLNVLGKSLTPGAFRPGDTATADELADQTLAFMQLAPVYASDEVLLAFMRFRMGHAGSPPLAIGLRLTDDLMAAMRSDLTGGSTRMVGMRLIGIRMNDLFTNEQYAPALEHTVSELAAMLGWVPPWDGHAEKVGLPAPKKRGA